MMLAACGGGDSTGNPPDGSVSSVSITPGPTIDLKLGATAQLSATARDAQGNALSGRTISWSSTASSIASVSQSGLVTGVSNGSAEIRATSEGKTGSVNVTVSQAAVATITLSTTDATLVPLEPLQLTDTLKDAAGTTLTGRTVTWSTNAAAVATVSNTGLVAAIAPGNVMITATAEGKSASANIVVAEGGYVAPTGGTVSTSNGNVTLVVPANALTTARAITIAPVTAPPAHPRLVNNTAYALGPDGTTFAQPVAVSIRWNSADVASGALPELFAVHRWNGAAWVQLPQASVDVVNRVATGTTTGFSTFAIIELPGNPVPMLANMAPASRTARGVDFTLTVAGTDFVQNAQVRWNGSARPTTFVSSTQLTAEISAADIAAAGTAQVTVFNPSPRGGTSAAQQFTIVPTAPCTTVCFVATNGHDTNNNGTSPNDAYLTLQKALNVVAPGGTINMMAGSHAGGTVIRSVSIRGVQAGLDARTRTGDESTILVQGSGAGLTLSNGNVNVTIDGLRFAASTSGAGTAILTDANYSGALTVNNSIFTYLINTTSVGLLRGIDASLGTAAVTAARNYFDRIGVLFGTAGRALSLGGTGAGAPATITNNLISGAGLRLGIVLGGGNGGSQITNNLLSASTSGSTGISIGATMTGAGTKINRNAITGHTAGALTSLTAVAVDATCNWWGAMSGPGSSINGSGATNVTSSPWLVSNNLAAGACTTEPQTLCGMTCYVSVTGDDGNSGNDAASPLRHIQGAINRVLNGGTIIVAPGVYNPNAAVPASNINTVTKSITFIGAKAGVSTTGRDPTNASTESIIRATQGLNFNTQNVTATIDGFTFQENAVNNSGAITVGASGADVRATIAIRNSIFYQMNIAISSGLGVNTTASSLAIAGNLFTGGNTAIQVSGGNNPAGTLTAALSITDNVFTGQTSRSVIATIWADAQLSRNTFTNTVPAGGNAVLQASGCVRCRLTDNVFTNPGGPNVINISGGNGTAVDNVVQGNIITSPTAANNQAIFIGQASGTLVSGNTITGARTAGISMNMIAVNTTVANNTISGVGAIGIHTGQGTSATPGSGTIVEENAISNIATGVRVDNAANVRRNIVTGATTAGISIAAENTVGTLINRNSIAGNTAGLVSLTITPVNATCNWWGAANGPSGAGSGSGSSVSANAVFVPFLTTTVLTGACQ